MKKLTKANTMRMLSSATENLIKLNIFRRSFIIKQRPSKETEAKEVGVGK